MVHLEDVPGQIAIIRILGGAGLTEKRSMTALEIGLLLPGELGISLSSQMGDELRPAFQFTRFDVVDFEALRPIAPKMRAGILSGDDTMQCPGFCGS